MSKEDMYHSCRWCKHYDNGHCTKDNFNVMNKRTWSDLTDKVELEIKEPESFYCKDWE